MRKEKLEKLKVKLDLVYSEFLASDEVQNDAITPALQYQDPLDREFTAFLCAILAYGKVAHIQSSVRKILNPLGPRPVEHLKALSESKIKLLTKNWAHRFNTAEDMTAMLLLLRHVYKNHGTLENYSGASHRDTAYELLERWIARFESDLSRSVADSFWFLLPRPSGGSACKRLNLFLRWMVGTSPTDLGLWKQFPKKHLIVPLDVHVHRQSLKLGLTKRKSADWKTAAEITEVLKSMDPEDPVRFDFPLCHIGIRKQEFEVL